MFCGVYCVFYNTEEAEKGIQKSRTNRSEKLRVDFAVKTKNEIFFVSKIRLLNHNMIYEKQISPFQG